MAEHINQIKINCDPYNKQIKYYWLEEKDVWSDLTKNNNSPFNDNRFTSNELQRIGPELLKKLKDEYAKNGSKLKIIFEGCDDDYKYLSSLIELDNINPANKQKCVFILEKGEVKYRSAEEVMPEIESAYENLYKYFREYKNNKVESILKKFKEATKTDVIPICVMGTYSSGKSTFINSLLGMEILPSEEDPTTAKIHRIKIGHDNEDDNKIIFSFNGKEYSLTYKNYSSYINNECGFVHNIIQEVIDKSPRNEEQFMFHTLDALNKQANENKDPNECLGDIIEIHIKNLKHSQLPLDKYKFVIYDTPGSNSETYEKHFDVLVRALSQQTNGLPIILTQRNSMDSKDNSKLVETIKKLGSSLSLINPMLVVNKADEINFKRKDTAPNNVLTKWTQNIFYVSSVIGLGGKKNNPRDISSWNNSDLHEIFTKNRDSFCKPDNEYYKCLFKYNKHQSINEVEVDEEEKTLSESELLLRNSGIQAVEQEIGRYAEKQALYNKCVQGVKYLSNAITILDESVKDADIKAKKVKDQIRQNRDNQKAQLISKLEEVCNSSKTVFSTNFADNVINEVVSYYTDEERISSIVDDAYNKSPGKKDREKCPYYCKKLDQLYSNDIEQYVNATSTKIDKYWDSCADELKKQLLKIVKENDDLTDEEKKMLNNIIQEKIYATKEHKRFNVDNTPAIKENTFLWIIKLCKIDNKIAKEEYRKRLIAELSEKNKTISTENETAFSNWLTKMINVLEKEVDSLNPKLRDLNEKLGEYERLIDDLNGQRNLIKTEANKINALFESVEVEL